jgi:hypothetical protein
MTEPSVDVQEKLAQAVAMRASEQTDLMPSSPAPQMPKRAKEATVIAEAAVTGAASPNGAPTAGSGTAKYLLLDHFFGGNTGTFWAYDGSSWRAAGTSNPDEQGMAQVAFAANRVDIWWDANNAVTIVRSWKYL